MGAQKQFLLSSAYGRILSHVAYLRSEIYTILAPATCFAIGCTKILYKIFMLQM